MKGRPFDAQTSLRLDPLVVEYEAVSRPHPANIWSAPLEGGRLVVVLDAEGRALSVAFVPLAPDGG